MLQVFKEHTHQVKIWHVDMTACNHIILYAYIDHQWINYDHRVELLTCSTTSLLKGSFDRVSLMKEPMDTHIAKAKNILKSTLLMKSRFVFSFMQLRDEQISHFNPRLKGHKNLIVSDMAPKI